jgi:hypothetical protein
LVLPEKPRLLVDMISKTREYRSRGVSQAAKKRKVDRRNFKPLEKEYVCHSI